MKRFAWLLAFFILACMVVGIVSLVATGSNTDAKEQQARVAVCAKVQPPTARGSCVMGDPLITKVVTKQEVRVVRVFPQYSTAWFIRYCMELEHQDSLNDKSILSQDDGNAVASLSGGFGTCLGAVKSLPTKG